MKKKIFLIIILILAGGILLCGEYCVNHDRQFYFEEREIEYPHESNNIKDIMKIGDLLYVCVHDSNGNIFYSIINNNGKKVENRIISNQKVENNDFYDINILSSDMSIASELDKNKQKLYIIEKEKKNKLLLEENLINDIGVVGEYIDENTLYIFYSNGSYKKYDILLSKLIGNYKLDIEDISRVESKNSNIYVYSGDFINVYKYSNSDFKLEKKIMLSNIENLKSVTEKYPLLISSNENIHFYNEDGVYEYDIYNQDDKLILDLNGFQVKDYRGNITKIIRLNGNYYILFTDRNGKNRVFFYEKKRGINKNEYNSIKVLSYKNSEYIQELVSDYSYKNKYNIDYKIISNSKSEILNGNIGEKIDKIFLEWKPDIVFLDGFDEGKLVKKGYLKEIRKKYEKIIIPEIQINRFNHYIPLSFNLFVQIDNRYDKSGLLKNDIVEKNKKLTSNRWFYMTFMNELYYEFFHSKNINNISSDDINQFLLLSKNYYSKTKNDWSSEGVFFSDSIDDYNINSVSTPIINMISNRFDFSCGEIMSIQDYRIAKSFAENNINSRLIVRNMYKPTFKISISSNKIKNYDFVDFALSDECQKKLCTDNGVFPTNNNVYSLINTYNISVMNGEIGETDNKNNMKTINLKKFDIEDVGSIRNILKKSDAVSFDDIYFKELLSYGVVEISKDSDINYIGNKVFSEYRKNYKKVLKIY